MRELRLSENKKVNKWLPKYDIYALNCESVLVRNSLYSIEIARGMIPRSAYLSGPPVNVNVLPLPVWPYANIVELKPSNK